MRGRCSTCDSIDWERSLYEALVHITEHLEHCWGYQFVEDGYEWHCPHNLGEKNE